MGDSGEAEYEVVRTNKDLGVPSWAITAALQEQSIVKAVNTLANEGVLPSPVARRILQAANQISRQIVESFDIDAGSEFINDKKALALIKEAVLGSSNE